MDKSYHEEFMLKLQCRTCRGKFYWESVYQGVGHSTKCPHCEGGSPERFNVLKVIRNGTKA